MATLKEIKTRIASVESTRKTTSAMKLISAVKLRKTQRILQHLKPFSADLRHMVRQTVHDGDFKFHSPLLDVRKPEKVLLIVVTSNTGLCGAFNTVVLKKALNHIKKNYENNPDIKEISIACFGRKAVEFFAKQPYNVVENHIEFMANLDYDTYDKIADGWFQAFKDKTYDLVEMCSNEFVNAVTYKTNVRQRLPFNIVKPVLAEDEYPPYKMFYTPDKNRVVNKIIPMSFKIRTYMRLIESVAAESAARMTSMHKATESAIVLQKDLQLRYNKARQAAITREIIEITTGAEAYSTA